MKKSISKKVLNALQDNKTKFTHNQLNDIVGDINSDSGISKENAFLLGWELGRLYQVELEQSSENGLATEINEAFEAIQNYVK